MPPQTADLENASRLRHRALARITGHNEATTGDRITASVAMGVLYELASHPDTAPDALALLHELQVHQVELELQDEEFRRSRDAVEADLSRQTYLYDHMPAACLTVDAATTIWEMNLPAAQCLGGQRERLVGGALDRFLDPGSAGLLRALLASAAAGDRGEPQILRLRAPHEAGDRALATVGPDATRERFLVVLLPMGAEG